MHNDQQPSEAQKSAAVKRNILVAVSAFIACLIIYYIVILTHRQIRLFPQFPFEFGPKLAKILRKYAGTRPSRSVIIVTGPYQSGKTRALNTVAQEMSDSQHCVINVDASSAKTFEDFVELFKLSATEALVSIKNRLTSADIKRFAELPSADSGDSVIGRPLSFISSSLDSLIQSGYGESIIDQFISFFESYEASLHPAIFIHGFDKIHNLSSCKDPRLGEKCVDAFIAKISRRNLYHDIVPVFLEVSDSLYLRMFEDSDVFRIVRTPSLEKEANSFIKNGNIFKPKEIRKIDSSIGMHGGSLSYIYEDLKFGVKLDDSIAGQLKAIEQKVKNAIGQKKSAVFKRFCPDARKIRLSNQTEVEQIEPLIKEGLISLKDGFRVVAASKAVARAICTN